MAELFELAKSNLGTVGTLIFLLLIWFDIKADAKKFLQKAWAWFERAQAFAEEKKLYEIAEKAYNATEQFSKKTESDVDDKVAHALGKAVRMLKKAGFDPDDEDTRELIKGYFEAINESAERAERLAGPFLPKEDGS